VQRLARSLVSGEDRADDVAQETWLHALSAPPLASANVRGWLTRVAQNVARKLARGERRRELHEARAPAPPPLPSAEQTLERATLQRRVVDAVLALDELYRCASSRGSRRKTSRAPCAYRSKRRARASSAALLWCANGCRRRAARKDSRGSRRSRRC
jgi:hypothetical protein